MNVISLEDVDCLADVGRHIPDFLATGRPEEVYSQ